MRKSQKKKPRKPRTSQGDYVPPTAARAAAIGRLISEWSNFEIQACYIAGRAFGLSNNKHARIIFGQEDWLGKLEKLRLLCIANKSLKALAALDAIAVDTVPCRTMRNLLAHGAWMKKLDPKRPPLVVASFRGSKDGYDYRIFPRYFRRSTAQIRETSAKIAGLIVRLERWQDVHRADLTPPRPSL